MGCGASVVKGSTNPKKPSTAAGQQSKIQTQTAEAPTLMASLQGYMPNDNIQDDEAAKVLHTITLENGLFPVKMPEPIESDNIVEFTIKGNEEYDIFEVYKDGNDYYRVINGYELLNIQSRTPENNRRLLLSFALNQPQIELYFCIIPSSQRETLSQTRKCPKSNCEKNRLIVKRIEIKFTLTDEQENQKVYLHKGDIIDMEWTATVGSGYRIEEKKYCPASGGLYTVTQPSDNVSHRVLSKGKFSKTCNDFGMSFLFRLTDTNQIHDITVCVVNETYKIKHIEITDNKIQPNIIWLTQNDWIRFAWNGKHKQTVVQIEPFTVSENRQQSIELKTEGENFFWPNEPSRSGCMYHQFIEAGIYCFKTGDNQIGTIIVEPRKNIHRIPLFSDRLTYKMNTNDLVQFDWKMNDSQEEPILITIEPYSSVVPDAAGGPTGIFDCAIHKCTKVETVFRHHFYTCEAYLLNIPQHGLYNFAYSDKKDNALISIIVENNVDNHRVIYNEQNVFDHNPLIINHFDRVWFDSSSTTVANIYQTDEFGNRLESEKPIFQPQINSINYYFKEFQQLGVYYFSTDINNNDKNKKEQNSALPLTVIVIPEIRFHYKSISKNNFNFEPIITNFNDFVVWQFEQVICHNIIQLNPDITYQELVSCHERAVAGRNRQCLAVECIGQGIFYFANPEFERVNGSDESRFLSTVIIDPPFCQNCFITTSHQFVPNNLYIAQNDTVSWTLNSNELNHQIYVQSNHDNEEIDDNNFVDKNISACIPGVHHLHTFKEPGEYIIRSNRFQRTATVVVYAENIIRNQKKQLQEPRIVEDIDTASQFGTQIHLFCPDRNADIFYTLDGSPPTRFFDNVLKYDPNEGLLLLEQGLHILRAYAIEDQKVSSTIITSSTTFVLENKELEAMNELRALWTNCTSTLSVSLEHPDKLYGNIKIEPTSSIDFIDYIELYINDVALKVNIEPTKLHFSAVGFAGGEQYEVYVVAYPKDNITHVEPISSNKRAFEIPREVHGGGPLISLALSSDQNTLLLMWAHIGDHVSEYIVYVDNIETKIITERDFNDFYGIHFHGAQQRKRYSFHIEAKIKNTNEIRKSNVIIVDTPLDLPVKGPVVDRYFPYITVNDEETPSNITIEKGSDRLSSSKLSIKSSSPSLPAPPSPAASSRPSIHKVDLNAASLNTSENIPQKTDDYDNDKTNNIKEQEERQQSPVSNEILTMQVKVPEKIDENIEDFTTEKLKTIQQQNENFILSDDSKRRAQDLLKQLIQAIENRSKQSNSNSNSTHPHKSFPGAQHYKDDQLVSQRLSVSSHDPFTDRLPPKPKRRSTTLNKNLNQTDNTMSNDTS
ncbi:unnamed protein product [Rotaria sordida]|uniref:Uncharacterized protein n=2 Tax=Rotaria sordida TaxID=392033 RepID=A0A813MTF4_9BILA|nr:unnamed protein product [Rotaria sordida]